MRRAQGGGRSRSRRAAALTAACALALTGCTNQIDTRVSDTVVPSHPSTGTSRFTAATLTAAGDGWLTDGTSVAVTTDGAQSVTTLPTLPVAIGTVADLAVSPQFLDLVAVTASGGLQVFGSTDDGRTWTAQQVPAPAGAVGSARFVTDARRLVALAVTDVSSSSFSSGEWYSWSGRAWARYAAPSGGTASDTKGFAWLAGGPQGDTLYRSKDSGQTWAPVPVPCAGSVHTYSAAPQALATGTMALPVTVPAAGGGATLLTCVSSDGGETWTPLASTRVGVDVGPGTPVPASVVPGAVWFVTPSGDRVVLVSADGELTVISPSGLPGGVVSVSASSETAALVTVAAGACTGEPSCTAADQVLETTDGGETWKPYTQKPTGG